MEKAFNEKIDESNEVFEYGVFYPKAWKKLKETLCINGHHKQAFYRRATQKWLNIICRKEKVKADYLAKLEIAIQ